MERDEKTTSRPPLGKRAVIYLRVAAADESKIAHQEDVCLKHLAQCRYIAINISKDNGVSGNTDLRTRPGLTQALEICEAGMADVLICYDLDRLSRDPNVLMNLLDRLEHAKIRLETVMEGDIFAHPSHLAAREVCVSILHIERRRNSQRASQDRKT